MEKLICQENQDVLKIFKNPSSLTPIPVFSEQNNLIKLTENQINKTSA